MASSLSPRELFKYGWRVERFLEKYLAEEPFHLQDKTEVRFEKNRLIIDSVTKRDAGALRGLVLTGSDGKTYRFSDLAKTAEFGGRGSGRLLEQMEISRLQTQLPSTLEIDGSSYRVASVESTPGTPRSDFHFLDESGVEVIWCSHKAGSTPADFQQWSGMNEPEIVINPEIVSFVDDVRNLFPEKIPRATTVARRIKDSDLQKQAVYGPRFGSETGRQNVSMVLQGNVSIVDNRVAAYHIHMNGQALTGGFEPVMMAMYKGDRNNFGIEGARFAIQPLDSRKALYI